MVTHSHQRRILLRGVLATGIGAVLAACDSQYDTQTSNTERSPTSPTTPTEPDQVALRTAERPKLSQEQVQYQTEPRGDQRCENCRHFIAEANECQLVEGVIIPEGWCTIWAN